MKTTERFMAKIRSPRWWGFRSGEKLPGTFATILH